MARPKPIATCDCETDPFSFGRDPEPFLWGYYDGKSYREFRRTSDFVRFIRDVSCILYAHNGGKFDFMFLLPFIIETRVQIINGRIISMMLGNAELRDSFACVPVGMGEIEKQSIDIWKMEKEHRETYWEEILERNRTDCVYLYNLMSAFRQRAGKLKTIASNALTFSKRLGIDPGKTSQRFDGEFRKFYFGGRTECFQPGTHKNVTVLDIRSAYPYAMMHDHATGGNDEFSSRADDFGTLDKAEIERSFIRLECTAKGCFPIRNGVQGLIFPHEFNEYYVTGWEYIAAKELGLIENERIITVHYAKRSINFTPYVLHWYKEKNQFSEKGKDGKRLHPIEYTIAKIMMNSLYGKLAQNPARYYDYRLVPVGTWICREPEFSVRKVKNKHETFCVKCNEKDIAHGWTREETYEAHELHSRESLWRYKYLYGDDWISKDLFKNVATGASITGFTRAHLLRAMYAIGKETVIYTDTDSLMCKASANLAALAQDDAIGSWEIENKNAPIGHFAGKKLYGISLPNGKFKIASKGAKLSFSDVAKIANGETITWKNQAPSYSVASGRIPGMKNLMGAVDTEKLFVVRKIRSTAYANNGLGVSSRKERI